MVRGIVPPNHVKRVRMAVLSKGGLCAQSVGIDTRPMRP